VQPWFWAIVRWGKRIENRSRKDGRMPAICRHRGPLLLHASKGMTQQQYNDAVLTMCERGLVRSPISEELVRDNLRRGGIVGVCNAIAHIDPSGRVWLDPEGTEEEPELAASLDWRWWFKGSYALVLADVRRTKLVPCRGALGLWTPPQDVVERALGDAR
jgi:hypothetical protein